MKRKLMPLLFDSIKVLQHTKSKDILRVRYQLFVRRPCELHCTKMTYFWEPQNVEALGLSQTRKRRMRAEARKKRENWSAFVNRYGKCCRKDEYSHALSLSLWRSILYSSLYRPDGVFAVMCNRFRRELRYTLNHSCQNLCGSSL